MNFAEEIESVTGVKMEALRSPQTVNRQKLEQRVMEAEDETETLPSSKVAPSPNKSQILASCSVHELLQSLNEAIRKEGNEHSIRVVPKAGLPFRLISPFISLNDTAVTFWLRRGTYEPFRIQDDTGQPIPLSLEFFNKKAEVIFVGGSTTLPGLDYDMVSFILDKVSELAVHPTSV
jgi:hypothetical protein